MTPLWKRVGWSSHNWRASRLSFGPKLCLTPVGNAIPPQVSGEKTEGETNQDRDRQIEHLGLRNRFWGTPLSSWRAFSLHKEGRHSRGCGGLKCLWKDAMLGIPCAAVGKLKSDALTPAETLLPTIRRGTIRRLRAEGEGKMTARSKERNPARPRARHFELGDLFRAALSSAAAWPLADRRVRFSKPSQAAILRSPLPPTAGRAWMLAGREIDSCAS